MNQPEKQKINEEQEPASEKKHKKMTWIDLYAAFTLGVVAVAIALILNASIPVAFIAGAVLMIAVLVGFFIYPIANWL